MSDTLRNPEEKTMAFGGVATGSMKAKEALKVHGIMTYSGFTPMDCDCTGSEKGLSTFYKILGQKNRLC